MKSHELIADALSVWRTIRHAPALADELFDKLSPEEIVRLARSAFADEVRKALTRKDSNGVPVYTNIDVINTVTGKKEKRYKQTAAFEISDWRASIDSYVNRGRASFAVAKALAAQCKKVTGVQMSLDEEAAS